MENKGKTMKIKKEMTLLEFINAFKSNEYYKKHFSFSGLEVLYNYLLTLDEDIDFCEGAIVAEWDEFEDILDFQKKTAGDTYPEYTTIKQLKEETKVLLFDKGRMLVRVY